MGITTRRRRRRRRLCAPRQSPFGQTRGIEPRQSFGITTQAKWLIKFVSSKDQRQFDQVERACITDKSIGIHYSITTPIFGQTSQAVRQELFKNYENMGYRDTEKGVEWLSNWNTKKYYKQVHDFINNIKVGDQVILGCGAHKALYVAEVAGDSFFTNEECWALQPAITGNPPQSSAITGHQVGNFIRRRLKNIRKLPENTKWEKKCMNTIKKRPSEGWGLTISQ